jgi:hypothetical protein
MSYSTLKDYYSLIFSLVQHHKYSISDLENLIPFERDIYVDMLIAYIESTKK